MLFANKIKVCIATIFWLLASISISFCQEVEIETQIEARLETVLVLNIDPEAKIEFGIEEINENLYQVTKYPVDVNFSVESTSNWNLSISAATPYFYSTNDSSQRIPVDIMGYTIENRGSNWDNGLFSSITNKTKDTIISLSHKENMILANGMKNNIGGADENNFILRWKFVFESDTSKFNRFRKLNLSDEFFSGRFYLTLSESQITGEKNE